MERTRADVVSVCVCVCVWGGGGVLMVTMRAVILCAPIIIKPLFHFRDAYSQQRFCPALILLPQEF